MHNTEDKIYIDWTKKFCFVRYLGTSVGRCKCVISDWKISSEGPEVILAVDQATPTFEGPVPKGEKIGKEM